MIVGVGGQGSLLASKLLGAVLSAMNYDVKVSEVHGMSQRGGSVVTYVRFGSCVYSPQICEGEADYIISFEKLEAVRYLSYLKKGGHIITNTQEIAPMATLSGKTPYPTAILTTPECQFVNVTAFDALSPAIACGSAKAVNMVLLGYFAGCMPQIPLSLWENAVKSLIAPNFLAINQKAFDFGYTYCKNNHKTAE